MFTLKNHLIIFQTGRLTPLPVCLILQMGQNPWVLSCWRQVLTKVSLRTGCTGSPRSQFSSVLSSGKASTSCIPSQTKPTTSSTWFLTAKASKGEELSVSLTSQPSSTSTPTCLQRCSTSGSFYFPPGSTGKASPSSVPT